MKERKKAKRTPKTQSKRADFPACVDAILSTPPSDTDPNGSYTGRPLDPNTVPVQDVDDL